MKNCEYCGDAIRGKRKTARFCSDFCRLRSFREKNGYRYQKQKDGLKTAKNVKSYTCCENAHFYSPVARWGELLICDNCGAVWKRLDKDPRIKDQDNQEPKENA